MNMFLFNIILIEYISEFDPKNWLFVYLIWHFEVHIIQRETKINDLINS